MTYDYNKGTAAANHRSSCMLQPSRRSLKLQKNITRLTKLMQI